MERRWPLGGLIAGVAASLASCALAGGHAAGVERAVDAALASQAGCPAQVGRQATLPPGLAPTVLTSTPANGFLDTLGVNTHVAQGYDAAAYLEPLRYLGLRNLRDEVPRNDNLLWLARQSGMRVNLLVGRDIDRGMDVARMLQAADVLLAVEGPNEPNNFPLTWRGAVGGGRASWLAVARFQAELYQRVEGDPQLAAIPVINVSETGAQTDNVGLQFLTVPTGTLSPAGTRFADFANVHNYVSGVNGGYGDNQAWQAADPVLRGRWDGLAGNHGITWAGHFKGYDDAALRALPRVTTETGMDSSADPASERLQAVLLVNTLLAQYARGWARTYLYELRDDEGGPSKQGLYRGNQPKLAAHAIHRLTTILHDQPQAAPAAPVTLRVALTDERAHAFLLRRSDGAGFLVMWGESRFDAMPVWVQLGATDHPTLHDVIDGAKPVDLPRGGGALCLTLRDHAVVLRL